MRMAKLTFFCVVSLLVWGLVPKGFAACTCCDGTCDTDCSTSSWYYYGWNWPDSSMSVPYYIHKDGASNCTGNEFRAVREAIKAWENIHQAYFAACYVDTTSSQASTNCTDINKDGKNVISWKDLGGGTPLPLGWACAWYETGTPDSRCNTTRHIVETDMALNNNAAVKWSALSSDSCISDRFDVQSVAAHEFGHWMDFDHSCDVLATMYCYSDSGSTIKRTVGSCDITAMKCAYPHTYGVPKPTAGCWPFYLSSSVATWPALGDIDRDGKKDAVFGTAEGLMHVISGKPTELYPWPDSSAMGSGFGGSPALGDINGDGWLEIVFGALNGKVYAIDHFANDLAGWPKNIGAATGTPAIGDIDNDGSMEVIVAANDSLVYAWNGDGTSVPGWPYKVGYASSGRTVGLADLDADDSLEVVVAAYDAKVYAIKPHGTALTGWPVTAGSTVFGPLAIGDIDSDNEFEVIVPGLLDSLYAWNADGSRCSGWPVYVQTGQDENCCTAPSLGDLDGDGVVEVLLGSRLDSVYAFDGNGSRLSGWPVYVNGISQGPPLVLDIDTDAGMEVIVATWQGKSYAFNGNGSQVSGWPVDFGALIPPRVAAGDVNGDQEIEVLVGCSGGNLCSFHLGTVEGGSTYQWSLYGHDNHRTCRYGYIPPEVEPIVFSDPVVDLGHWDLSAGGAGSGGLSSNSYSPPYSLEIQSGPGPGDFAGAYSEHIVVDFERPYEMNFYFSYDGFTEAKWFVFGHARLYLQSPGAPVMYDPVGDWSSLVPIGPVVGGYFPPGTWERVEISVDPQARLFHITVAGMPLGTAAYQETVVPSNRIWFTDEPYLNSELFGYYDDFEVRGYLPVISAPEQSPPAVLVENMLYQSFPNPMNPLAVIRYSVKESGHVEVRIFDVAGRLVRILVDEFKTPSPTPYSVIWDAKDENGLKVTSGVYFCQMETKKFRSTKKIVVLK